MDPKAHRRFLEYIEKHEYFGGRRPRLTREQWEALDAEREPLQDAQDREAIGAEELTRLMQLRRVLLVD